MSRRPLALLFAATAILRLAHLAVVHDAPFVGQLALDSQEYDRWARAIAAGDWLGSAPFFQAPLYPYLVALVYRFLAAAPMAVYVLQVAASVLGWSTVAVMAKCRRSDWRRTRRGMSPPISRASGRPDRPGGLFDSDQGRSPPALSGCPANRRTNR